MKRVVFLVVFQLTFAGLLACAGQSQEGDPKIPADTKIVTTDSGLKYSILKKGDGTDHPGLSDTVKVHYSGWLENGELFDSSVKRGTPSEFKPTEVIPGWTEGLMLMTPGAKFKFTIPYTLAYGERGRPPKIPPKSNLIFEVELLRIEKGPAIPEFKKGNPEKQKKTESGLVYEVLTPGTGEMPKNGDNVHIKFAFWNTKGQIVDSTEIRGRDLKFPVGAAAVKILNEGTMLLKEGARYRFEVPPELAFGDNQASIHLPPNSVSIWEIELVKILKPLPIPKFSKSPEDKVKTTKSGLKYEVIKEGTGPSPKLGQEVTCHYAGWLEDGTLFDSSYGRGDTSTFQLGRVIQGWNEGLQLMKEGAVYKFTIPGKLGYGRRGSPPKIPPDATLIFYVELVKAGK